MNPRPLRARRLAALAGRPQLQPAWRCLLAGLLATTTWLALAPAPPPSADLGWDKLNHLAAFAVLAAVARLGFDHAAWRLGAALLAYGGLIELLQGCLPPRQADAVDWLTDALGTALGLLLATVLRRLAGRAPARD